MNRNTPLKRSAIPIDYDANRQWHKRSNRNAKQPTTPRTGLKKVSKKMAQKKRVYRVLVEQFMLENPFCKRCADQGIETPSCDPHHQGGRDGERLTDFSKIIPLCRRCHNWMKDHGHQAIEQGYSVSRHRTCQGETQ